MASGIYAIVCYCTGKAYVGSAVNIKSRWRKHISDLRKNKSDHIYLQRAWNKYGERAFKFIVLELVPDRTNLIAREQHYIDLFQAADRGYGYNLLKVAGSHLGAKRTQETKRKISESNMGRAGCWTGKKRPQEFCEKMRELKKGYKPSPETLEKIAATNRGKKHSDATRRKISEAHKGKIKTPEHLANIGAALRGRTATEEAKRNQSEAHKGKPLSPEHRAALSLPQQRRHANMTPEQRAEHGAKISAGIRAYHERRRAAEAAQAGEPA